MIEFRENNFNLIRLFAATQVVLVHSYHHLNINNNIIHEIIKVIELFPGVPIFFFISGFLISKSYRNNRRLVEYAQNRILRIYPALWVCFILSVLSVVIVGYLNISDLLSLDFLKWLAAQMSFFQFYNPEFMREYGVGALNGSLWTIAVELQFYILIPLLYVLKLMHNKALIVLIFIFMILNRIILDIQSDDIIYKLIRVSFVPWLYMFLVGVFFQENFEKIKKILEDHILIKTLLILSFYLFIVLFVVYFEYGGLGNSIHPILFLPLTFFIIAFAYLPIKFTELIKRNDLSYGVYIYHMPIVNLFIYMGYIGSSWYYLMAIIFTYLFALLSWRYVERPALAFKKHPLNPVNRGNKI